MSWNIVLSVKITKKKKQTKKQNKTKQNNKNKTKKEWPKTFDTPFFFFFFLIWHKSTPFKDSQLSVFFPTDHGVLFTMNSNLPILKTWTCLQLE